jgi:hypothetical protein
LTFSVEIKDPNEATQSGHAVEMYVDHAALSDLIEDLQIL